MRIDKCIWKLFSCIERPRMISESAKKNCFFSEIGSDLAMFWNRERHFSWLTTKKAREILWIISCHLINAVAMASTLDLLSWDWLLWMVDDSLLKASPYDVQSLLTWQGACLIYTVNSDVSMNSDRSCCFFPLYVVCYYDSKVIKYVLLARKRSDSYVIMKRKQLASGKWIISKKWILSDPI